MTIYGDYGKNLNNNNINFNTDKKAGQAKAAETAKETIDVTGAKYRGELTDLGRTPEGLYGRQIAFSGVGKTQQMFTAAFNDLRAEFPNLKKYYGAVLAPESNIAYVDLEEAFNYMA